MTHAMAALLVLVVGLTTSSAALAADGCGGGGGGSISGGLINVGADDAPCEPSELPAGAGFVYVRTVKSEPLLCPGTPDGLQETIEWFDPATNERVGSITRCLGPNVPDPALPAPAPSGESLFRQAPLPLPEVRVNPRVRGLVGLETYLWWGADLAVPPLSVTAGEWTAAIEVQASRITWDLGNGDVLTADSAGTSDADPSLTYVYTEQCDCTITLTVEWSGVVTLTHPLAPGPIVEQVGPVAFTDSFDYVVDEREAVIVG